MRKWVLGVLVGALLAVAAVGGTSAYINGGWPETCLEMNDMVEASPLGSGAVGIYQRAFGGQAEAACQNDHRDDVRRAFAWAIGGASTPTQPSQPAYIYNVTARDIAREFETNEHASTEKYKGKFFRVTGVVEEVKFSDYENDWFLVLDAAFQRYSYHNVECRFLVRHEAWLGNLTPGQSVSISGYFAEYDWNDVELKDCGPA